MQKGMQTTIDLISSHLAKIDEIDSLIRRDAIANHDVIATSGECEILKNYRFLAFELREQHVDKMLPSVRRLIDSIQTETPKKGELVVVKKGVKSHE